MADTKVSDLTELAVGPADTDEIYINDGGTSKRIQAANLLNPENLTALSAGAASTDEVAINDGGVGKKITVGNLLLSVTNFTELSAGPAGTDELLINDGGTIKKITAVELLNPENFTELDAVPADADEVFISDNGTGKRIAWSNLVPAASATVAGKTELATIAELETGTDTGRTITPDVLAGSNLGERVVEITVVAPATNTVTGDGKAYFHVPSTMTGMNLVEVHAEVITAGAGSTTTIMLRNATQSADMLSTILSIDASETGSDTAATPAVINTSEDDITTNDMLAIDVDQIGSSTAAKGLIVTMTFRLP